MAFLAQINPPHTPFIRYIFDWEGGLGGSQGSFHRVTFPSLDL